MAATPEIAAFEGSGWLPDSFFASLAGFYAAYDAFIDHNVAASQLKIMCRAGCSRCCRQVVHGVYSFEVINLYRQLRTSPDYPRIHDRFLSNANDFQALLARAEQAAAANPGTDAMTIALRGYAAAGKWCPLLVDNQCSVYENRPVPCRMYHSLTDPILCVTPIGHTFNIEPPEPANAIMCGVSDRLAFPFSNFLAQGLVAFAARRQFRPWTAPAGHA